MKINGGIACDVCGYTMYNSVWESDIKVDPKIKKLIKYIETEMIKNNLEIKRLDSLIAHFPDNKKINIAMIANLRSKNDQLISIFKAIKE